MKKYTAKYRNSSNHIVTVRFRAIDIMHAKNILESRCKHLFWITDHGRY